MAEIGQPEREIDVRPAELPVPSELPLDPPVPARARPRAGAGGAMRRLTTWLGRRALPRPPREATREPLGGWRVWRVVDSRHGPALASWRVGTVWPARRELQSGCFIHGPRAPVQHRCGIHAFDAQGDALAYAEASQERLTLFDHRPAGIAVGRVSCWGHVVHHTLGWRSQFAYPYDPFLLSADPSLARLLSRRYAVDATQASDAYGTLRAYSRN